MPARLLNYVLLTLVAGAFVLPLAWMLAVSLKPAPEVLQPNFIPRSPILESYATVSGLSRPAAAAAGHPEPPPFNFPLFARNTLVIAVLSLIGMVLSSAIAAYGFARLRFPGRSALFAVCLATMMIPFPVIMVPTYMIFKQLGWIGTFLPLWVPAWFGSAFNIFLLRQFFLGIPLELQEAALLDGCSTWGVFWRIMLPLARPALAVVALFHVLAVWNDLIGPLICPTSTSTRWRSACSSSKAARAIRPGTNSWPRPPSLSCPWSCCSCWPSALSSGASQRPA